MAHLDTCTVPWTAPLWTPTINRVSQRWARAWVRSPSGKTGGDGQTSCSCVAGWLLLEQANQCCLRAFSSSQPNCFRCTTAATTVPHLPTIPRLVGVSRASVNYIWIVKKADREATKSVFLEKQQDCCNVSELNWPLSFMKKIGMNCYICRSK